MTYDPRRVQSIFLDAVKVTSPAGRAELLEIACADDDDLHRRVTDLLRVHELPDNALDTPALDSLSVTPCLHDAQSPRCFEPAVFPVAGTVIDGRYRLLERLGEGGMGTVFRAEQIAPIRRSVAVKLIRPNLGTSSTLARFASERQALALMDHPNIAKVLDAGAIGNDSDNLNGRSNTGRPYFVMELVEGVALTKYCADHKLSLRQRLELFIPVCLAIQHAHQKGVIHRDLKPGNVIVTNRDRQAVPVVIDFGIAKSIGKGIDDVGHDTGPGLLMGSLDYMAPEQAANDSTHVDTRTDVYALGAMLYELVTGSVPFDRERMRQASVFGIASIICEEVPAPPSDTVIAKHEAAVKAGLPVNRLAAQLHGDIDWVVMKCLEKKPERRYPAASALADELIRYLNGTPVVAGAPTAAYRVTRFLRRHYRSVAAAALVALSMTGGIAGLSWGLWKAKLAQSEAIEERDDKEVALRNEEKQRVVAEKERSRADSEANIAKAVVGFLQTDLLRHADSNAQVAARFDPDPNLTVRAALDRAAATVERRFSDQPGVEAAIRRTIGRSYDGLGEFGKAINHLTRSVAIYITLPTEAEALEAANYDLGIALRHASRFDEAIPLLERAHASRHEQHGPTSRTTLAAATHLGIAYEKAGRVDESYRLFTEVYERLRESDNDSMTVMAALNNLACLDANRGRLDDAIRRMQELQVTFEQNFGTTAPNRLELLLNIGQLYLRAGRWDEAIRTLTDARTLAQSRLSAEHPSLITSCFFLAEAYARSGQVEEAGRALEACRSQCLDKVGPTHVRYHVTTIEFASWAAESGQLERAKSLMEGTLKTLAPVANTAAFTKATAENVLARTLYLMGRAAEAEPLARNAVTVFAARRPDDWVYADARVSLGLILAAKNQMNDAEAYLSDGIAGFKRLENQLPHTARRKYTVALEALVHCAELRNADLEVEAWRAEHLRVSNLLR